MPFRINLRLLSLGSPHGRQRGADKVVDHRKELFLWALAFESGMDIIPLGNGEAPRSEDPQSGGCLTPLGIKFPV